jgi:hypothetical protein
MRCIAETTYVKFKQAGVNSIGFICSSNHRCAAAYMGSHGVADHRSYEPYWR